MSAFTIQYLVQGWSIEYEDQPSVSTALVAQIIAVTDPEQLAAAIAAYLAENPPDGAALSDVNPEPLGVADPGTAEEASRSDHVHPLPSPADIGAAADDDSRLSDSRTPTGGAGGALSGDYPDPGLNTEAVQDLVGAMAGSNLTYDDTAGTISVSGLGTAAVAALLDEDDMASDSATGVPSQQSVKAYVDANAGGAWEVLHDADVNTASLSVDITGYKQIRGRFFGRSGRTGFNADDMAIRFNNDTGNNYSTQTFALTSYLSSGTVPGSQTNTDRRGLVEFVFGLGSSAYTIGGATADRMASTATVVAGRAGASLIWNGSVSNAPTSIQLYCLNGNLIGHVLIEGVT